MSVKNRFSKVELIAFLESIGISREAWIDIEKTKFDCPGYYDHNKQIISVIPRDALAWMDKNKVQYDKGSAKALYDYPADSGPRKRQNG